MSAVRVDFITNQAPHYRAALWNRLLEDKTLDARFMYGDGATSSIHPIDLSEPRWHGKQSRFHRLHNIYVRNVLLWQRGVLGAIRSTDAQALVLLGQMTIVSMWFAAWLARRRGILVLFWGHGAYGRESWLKRAMRNRFLGLADGLLVYGEHARRLLIEDNFSPNRISVVYNSLDHARQRAIRKQLIQPDFIAVQGFFNEASPPTLLFVGRLTPQKRLEHLIDAIVHLRGEGRIFNLLIIGDGPESQRLRTRAAELKGHVHFYGACYEEKQLGRLIANADLCVSPGEVGLTAMHALGYGTPVCTHSDMSRQMPEAEAIVEGRTGIFFHYDDMDLAGAIGRWFDAVPDRGAIRSYCYEEIDRKWNTETQARRITQAIQELADQDA